MPKPCVIKSYNILVLYVKLWYNTKMGRELL